MYPVRSTTQLQVEVSTQADLGFGCGEIPRPDYSPEYVLLGCPLRVPISQVRYRFTLSDRADEAAGAESASGPGQDPRGVIYGREGPDVVFNGDRVYAGPGGDWAEGNRVYGGPGSDFVAGYADAPRGTQLVYGGPGDDTLEAGRLYGGPGDDQFFDRHSLIGFKPRADMMVGGPGRDVVSLQGDDRSDVVRIRGGGIDRVLCVRPFDRDDTLFVDRADFVSPTCKNTRILLTGRPRYPYP